MKTGMLPVVTLSSRTFLNAAVCEVRYNSVVDNLLDDDDKDVRNGGNAAAVDPVISNGRALL